MTSFNFKDFKYIALAVLILLGIGFFATRIYFANKPSVLYRYKDKAAVDPGQDLFVIFNPFRNKKSEATAENFLDMLKKGNCEQIKIQVDCERENDNDLFLQSWKLIDREDSNNQVVLHFQGFRASYPQNTYSNIWITSQNIAENWTIIDYQSWY